MRIYLVAFLAKKYRYKKCTSSYRMERLLLWGLFELGITNVYFLKYMETRGCNSSILMMYINLLLIRVHT